MGPGTQGPKNTQLPLLTPSKAKFACEVAPNSTPVAAFRPAADKLIEVNMEFCHWLSWSQDFTQSDQRFACCVVLLVDWFLLEPHQKQNHIANKYLQIGSNWDLKGSPSRRAKKTQDWDAK